MEPRPSGNAVKALLAEIVEVAELAERHISMWLKAPEAAETAHPGQFLHVLCSSSYAVDPFLRRPLSVYETDFESGLVRVVFKVVGRGTSILSEFKAGQVLDFLGPLGRGFPRKLWHEGKDPLVIVAGGIGVAPLVFLAQKASGRVPMYGVLGASTSKAMVGAADLMKFGVELTLATEDGSLGKTGVATEFLPSVFSQAARVGKPTIAACGPGGMLREVKRFAQDVGVNCYFSLEEKMGCGVGACHGCVVLSVSGKYLKVCQDGPVFALNDLL